MSVTEAERSALRTALTEQIGEEFADILMRSTLPQGSDQLATKDDIDALGTRVEGEFAKVHGKLDGGSAKVHGEFAKVHGKLDGGSAKVHGEFARVHGKLDGGFAKVHGEFAKVHAQLDGESAKAHDAFQEYESESPVDKQMRKFQLTLAGVMVTIWVTLMVAFIVLTSR